MEGAPTHRRSPCSGGDNPGNANLHSSAITKVKNITFIANDPLLKTLGLVKLTDAEMEAAGPH